jgi:hypothetical protein
LVAERSLFARLCVHDASFIRAVRELSQATATVPFPLGIVGEFGIYPKHHQACNAGRPW